jgi:hypothetical protein
VKQLSPESQRVIKHAVSNPKFRDDLLSRPDAALKSYSLGADELEYFRSLASMKEIEADYQTIQAAEAPFRWLPTPGALYTHVAVWAILLVLIAAWFLDRSNQHAWAMKLGILSSPEVPPYVDLCLGLLGLVCGVMFILTFTRMLFFAKPATRVALLIGVVVLLFIVPFVSTGFFSDVDLRNLTRGTLVIVFTLLPASLYSLFVVTRHRVLWDEFDHHLSHLDPVMYDDLVKIYRKKFEAVYGPINKPGSKPIPLPGEALFPVLLATFIIGVGWVLYFAVSRDWCAQVKLIPPIDLFIVCVHPFTFGFLGAYLFSLSLLFRRYAQSDLKATAYTHVSQRILLTWVWALVLTVLWNATSGVWVNESGAQTTVGLEMLSILAFVVGVMPDIAWQLVSKALQRVLAIPIPSLRQGYPLNEIEGITIWNEARLLEEGVENVQQLVTSNIFDLILETNLPPERVLNWIDRGILQLHLGPRSGNGMHDTLREALNGRGITTATDLLDTYATFKPSEGVPFFLSQHLDSILGSLVLAVKNDPNMYHVQAWHELNTRLQQKLPAAMDTQMTGVPGSS